MLELLKQMENVTVIQKLQLKTINGGGSNDVDCNDIADAYRCSHH